MKKGVKLLHELFNHLKTHLRFLLLLLLAFLAGCLFTGLFFNRHRFTNAGELDRRYNFEHASATETVRRLERELERERGINRQLREHNSRAREIAEGLADTSERNVRNLQDAIGLIQEIREKIKILEDFYSVAVPAAALISGGVVWAAVSN